MSTSIDQKAYLQKYLSGPSKDKKKKKKKEKKLIKGKGFVSSLEEVFTLLFKPPEATYT